MADRLTVDFCVIGGGSAGLTAAAGAAQMGADTVLIEQGKMGGDCLNTGCVPSKSLLAAGKAARGHIRAAKMGIRYAPPVIDFRAVHDHVHAVIAAIAPADSVERFEGLGVRVLQDAARFIGPREVAVGETIVRAGRFLIATGSRALVPPITGLDRVAYLTNETVFELTACPEHLVIIGGGPIGCELGQAFRRLGARVSLIEMFSIMPKDDPELVEVVRTNLRADGIELHEQSRVVRVEATGSGEQGGPGVTVVVERDGAEQRVEGTRLLLAAGRRPTVDGLALDAAGIEHDARGIKVDARLRTSNRRVYAAGDVAGGLQFTHVAGYHAGIVLRNVLFRLPAKVHAGSLPWITFTDPELAHVGLTEAEVRARHGKFRVLRWPLAENDRAQAERQSQGLVKVLATPGGRILGASVVGPHAGEIIQPWVLALSQGLKVGALAKMVAPYPTWSEINKRAAGSFFAPKLFNARTRAIVRFLARFN